MKNTNSKVELVAPAGGWDHLKAALNAGADAVYLGYNRFGARAYAQNFDLPMLKKAAVLAHCRNAKIYLTLNTLIKDSEFPEVARFLNQYSQVCQDGIIIQDFGAYRLIRDLFPHLRIHASTQMNIHSLNSVLMLQKMGLKRVVMAREMTLGQIKYIAGNSDIEIEVFGHGSQCFAFSGNCYLSSFTGERSGNRGRCSQPCRMKYRLLFRDNHKFHIEEKKHAYYLSKRDLHTLQLLPQLIDCGVDAIKIEGRMKTPEYVGIVTKIYKKYIDEYYEHSEKYSVDNKDSYKLDQIFLRDSGPGYLKETFPSKIINPKSSGSIGNFAGRIESIEYNHKKKKVEAIVMKSRIPLNSQDLLEVWTNKGNERITVREIKTIKQKGSKILYRIDIGKNIKVSENDRVFKYFDHKLDGEAKSLYKYGNNRIKINRDNEQPDLKEYELNYYLSSYKLDQGLAKEAGYQKTCISVSLHDMNMVMEAADCGAKHIIYNGLPQKKIAGLNEYCLKKGAKLFFSLPPISYDQDYGEWAKKLDLLADEGFSNFEVCSLAWLYHILKLKNSNADIIIGRDLNIYNTLSAVYMAEKAKRIKISEIELSSELNIEEMSNLSKRLKEKHKIGLSIFAHGYFPVMGARYRIDMLSKKYLKNRQYYLEDLKGYKFRIDADIWGNMLVFNPKKICIFFDLDKILGKGLDFLRLDMRFLDIKNHKKIIEAYLKAMEIISNSGWDKYRRFCNYFRDDILFKDYTRGHLLRGVK